MPARDVDFWAQEKLFYVNGYMDIFSNGMKSRWPRLAYIDLFAGPGVSILHGTNREISGSPLLALNPRYPFTHFFLNEGEPSLADALRQRVSVAGRREAIVTNLDCNEAARQVGDAIFGGPHATSTLGLAFIDPTAFQVTFESIAEMTRGRKIDLIITVMTGYLKRFIDHPSFGSHLDPFFGSATWRNLVDLKSSGERITFRKLLDHYERQLRAIGYQDVDDDIRVLNSKNSTIYHLVFASKDKKGLEFFKKISKKTAGGQGRLPF